LTAGLTATPATAETLGLRPLGGDYESARTVGNGHYVIEGGVWAPVFADPPETTATQRDFDVLANWRLLPAWPEFRGIYGLGDGNEVVAHIGPIVGGGYRKHFLRAEAPWGGEYLQGLIQLGGGFHLASRLPMGYIRFPGIYEVGAFTFHVAGGGYYLFNQQPMVDVNIGTEYAVWNGLQLGVLAHLRMDSKKITPMDGVWSFGGGARYRIGERFTVQVDVVQDAGPPLLDEARPQPMIEFPHQSVRASAAYYF